MLILTPGYLRIKHSYTMVIFCVLSICMYALGLTECYNLMCLVWVFLCNSVMFLYPIKSRKHNSKINFIFHRHKIKWMCCLDNDASNLLFVCAS